MQDGCLILLMEAVLVKAVEQRLDRIDAILPGLEKTLLGMQGENTTDLTKQIFRENFIITKL